MIKAKANFSVGGYLSFAALSVRLVYYTGNCMRSSSRMKAELMAVRDMAE